MGTRIACETGFIAPPNGQPQAVFGGYISISGGRLLFRTELVRAEDRHNPHISMQHVITNPKNINLKQRFKNKKQKKPHVYLLFECRFAAL